MTINKTSTNKSVIELRREMSANGISMENVYVDGHKFCVLGSTNEADKANALKTIQAAVDGSNNIYEAMMKLTVSANLTDKAVEPDEEVTMYGIPMYISYADKTMYNANGSPYVDCKELTCELPNEACKVILMQRAEAKLTREDDEAD